MNRIKSDSRASLSQLVSSALIRTCMKGTEFDSYDLISAISLCNDSVKARRLNQKKSQNYKKCRTQSLAKTLVDESTS